MIEKQGLQLIMVPSFPIPIAAIFLQDTELDQAQDTAGIDSVSPFAAEPIAVPIAAGEPAALIVAALA